MEITPVEARKALADANQVAKTTRTVAAMAGTDLGIMAWGVVWFTGYLWSHLITVEGWPNGYHAGWFPLVAVGGIITLVIEKRRKAPVTNSLGGRIGLLWGALFGYQYLLFAILSTHLDRPLFYATPEGAKTVAAIFSILPMFAYVVMGLWLEQRFLLWIGLALSVIISVAYFHFLPVFFPLMAVAGGGVLFGCGLWMRLRVRRAMRGLETHV